MAVFRSVFPSLPSPSAISSQILSISQLLRRVTPHKKSSAETTWVRVQ